MTVKPLSVEAALNRIAANVELAVGYGREANERLGRIEQRISALERHVGLNGQRERDTMPAQPEDERSEEV